VLFHLSANFSTDRDRFGARRNGNRLTFSDRNRCPATVMCKTAFAPSRTTLKAVSAPGP
jgi:hypothetical protein